MPRPVQKIENLNRLRALERPEAPWVRKAEPNDTQQEFLKMADKLDITIGPSEPMVQVPMCLLQAIVERLR